MTLRNPFFKENTHSLNLNKPGKTNFTVSLDPTKVSRNPPGFGVSDINLFNRISSQKSIKFVTFDKLREKTPKEINKNYVFRARLLTSNPPLISKKAFPRDRPITSMASGRKREAAKK